MSSEKLFIHPAMLRLRRAIRRELRLKLFCSAALWGAGLTLCLAFFQSSIFLTVLGLACAVSGIRLTRRFFEFRRVDDSRLMRLLRYHPGQVVWAYSVVTQRLPFGLRVGSSCTLYLKLIDGDEVTVSLPEKDARLVSHLLNRLLPHATFGYTRDREQWFLANPELLLRGGEQENTEG
ncbi:MAG: hypothetical protein H6564_19640 [Lewinellaceae bacterium]|nr:hypothetical protein [Lewinellaceae bacterium]